MVSSYSRIASLLPSRPVGKPETAGVLKEIQQAYVAPPQIITDRLGQAAGKIGLNVMNDPTLLTRGRSGEMVGNGVLRLSPSLGRGRARVLAHEMGHWQQGHRNQNLPHWTEELEAEAIASDILQRTHPEKAQQHADYAAAYMGGLQWNPNGVNLADELMRREEALRKAADYIIQSGIPEGIRNRSPMAMRMSRAASTPAPDYTSYDSGERWAFG